MYKLILRPILFLFSPEKAHYISFVIFNFLIKMPFIKWFFRKKFILEDKRLEQEIFGLKFNNPVGLAAGFDKNAKLLKPLSYLGFGFIEIGTVTPLAQQGNPTPRLFRLPKDKALINRMGFNNEGVETVAKRLRHLNSNLIIGGNIGKNKTTLNENAVSDYEICFEFLFEVVDYFAVNVSSPNTPDLRSLQDKKPLTHLLQHLQVINNKKTKPKPILLKIAPDLTNTQLDDIIDIVMQTKIAGVIATNTTISRDNLATHAKRIKLIGLGGLSGKVLKDRSTKVIKYLFEKSNRKLKIIAVGGIQCPKDALEKLKAGACLVQIYTGFIYEGPSLIKKINKEILEKIINDHLR